MKKDLMVLLKEPHKILTIFMGLVFLSAGVYRTFFFSFAVQEASVFGLPSVAAILIIIFEIVCGFLLIINKYTKIVLSALLIFLGIAVITGFVVNGLEIIQSFGELFVFDPTPTDTFLHITFVVILSVLLLHKKKK